MLLTRYNKYGTMLKVDRSGLKSVEKAGFIFTEYPKEIEVQASVEKVVVEPVAEVAEPVESTPAPVKKRGRKPAAKVVEAKEPEKDIVL